jgi:hypothetical protein
MLKWISVCVGAAFIAALAWITLEYWSPPDIRSQIQHSQVVAYGHFVSDASRPRIVIDEIWKRSSSADSVAVGSTVPFTLPASSHAPDAAIVCFAPRLLSRRLAPSAVFAVYGDHVGLPPLSLSEVKALCAATPST